MYSSAPIYLAATSHVGGSEIKVNFRRIVMVETVARWGHNALLLALGLMFYALALSLR
jgi:hypothetical protein